MPDDLEQGKKTTKKDEEFEAPTTGGVDDAENLEKTDDKEFELTPEIKAENLEKGKNIAMGKIMDVYKGVTCHSGTHVANMESLALFGPDISKAKAARWDPIGTHSRFYFRKMSRERGFNGEDYPIRFIFDMDSFKKLRFTDKGRTESDYRNWLNDDSGNQSTIQGLESPEIFGGIELTNSPFENFLYDLEGPAGGKDLFHSILTEDEYLEAQRNNNSERIEKSAKLIRKFAVLKMIEIAKKAPERALPIYNDGDLVWPKQMSYEEVKKFVAERDAQKKEQE